MAGGGTGSFGGPGGAKPYVPPFNTTTAGTGAMGTGKPVVINQTPTGNPFGPGSISYDINQDWFSWTGNKTQSTPIAFIGDNTTGKYLPSTSSTLGLDAGSPLDMNEAIGKIIMDYNKKPGGIESLKTLLNEKQMYANPKSGAMSLAQGSAFDPFFNQALQTALMYATASNAQLAATQGANPKILSFDQFMANAPTTGSYDSSSFGGGGTKRQVVHQKFKPEEFEIAIDQLFQQTVGRGASEDELNDFVSKLQAYEKKNPQVTVSKTSGNTTTQTQSGGVDSNTMQSMMRDSALANPEAEGYNKATKYLDYFMNALKSPIELG
jgi:hypothetical protein